MEGINQEVISSDYVHKKENFHLATMIETKDNLKQIEDMEPKDCTEGMALDDINRRNKLEQSGFPNSEETVLDVQFNDKQNEDIKRNKIQCGNQYMNETTHIEDNTEFVTSNVDDFCIRKRYQNGHSKESKGVQGNEEASLLSCDTKLSSESYMGFENSSFVIENIHDSRTESHLPTTKHNNVESDTTENNNSPESQEFVDDPSVPPYFNELAEGMQVCGDSRCSLDSKPSWLDFEKYQRGQRVAMKYLFGIQFAQYLSLLVLFSSEGGVESLVFTGKSDTPFKAFKRYLSTALRIKSWYVDDLWNPQSESRKNLKKVRAMHEQLRKNLEALDPEERNKRSTLSGRCESGCPALWSTLNNELREDFERTCPYSALENHFKKLFRERVCVNQTEMSITQFGFVGLFIKYPDYFGAHNITDEELDSFVHLWRCIGYLLGVEDKYNFCNSDLETVKQRTTDLIEFMFKPNLRRVTQEWEHMSRCVTEGVSYYVPGVTFEVSLQYLCDVLGLHTPRLWAALTFRQKIVFYLTQFTFWFLLRLPGSLEFHSRITEKSMKRGENIPPTRLKELQEKRYPYQENICA